MTRAPRVQNDIMQHLARPSRRLLQAFVEDATDAVEVWIQASIELKRTRNRMSLQKIIFTVNALQFACKRLDMTELGEFLNKVEHVLAGVELAFESITPATVDRLSGSAETFLQLLSQNATEGFSRERLQTTRISDHTLTTTHVFPSDSPDLSSNVIEMLLARQEKILQKLEALGELGEEKIKAHKKNKDRWNEWHTMWVTDRVPSVQSTEVFGIPVEKLSHGQKTKETWIIFEKDEIHYAIEAAKVLNIECQPDTIGDRNGSVGVSSRSTTFVLEATEIVAEHLVGFEDFFPNEIDSDITIANSKITLPIRGVIKFRDGIVVALDSKKIPKPTA